MRPRWAVDRIHSMPALLESGKAGRVRIARSFNISDPKARVGSARAAGTAEPAFKKVWDNPDDAAYDKL
jgi:hypothetical protein